MTLSEVKSYLRVDYNDDDTMIQLMMEAAEETIIAACGEFNEEKPRAKMIYLAMVQDMYDNRTLVSEKKHLREMYRSLLTQLQVEQCMEDDNV